MVLAAIASRTERVTLGSAVTVLASDDPVRVFQRFSTLDAVSNGRAEVILGRGSFTESFPLFGYDLADYEVLFEEKLDLFSKAPDRVARDLAGHHPFRVARCRRVPQDRFRLAHHLGGRGRLAPVGGPHGEVRPAPDARDHRR
ncbi:hypothetical protein GCM10025876_05450 [Demequina litorisediminis]|uniref:Luciferase-like domain-containing protein n=1 Tax=Demequina litorisediminis TaxID=1849022 RepID=A0ABQ6IA57_9MICO|nr:hypothetical protein GCM10025876_05450 [Demequina litorisediminis]